MFRSRAFRAWVVCGLCAWVLLFASFSSGPFLIDHWYYPAVMVAGAFVAGFTPQGGGAVAFPVLSIFLHIDRVLARDFSMMIQSVGMTSASIFILSLRDTELRHYRPLLAFVPVCFLGFVLGMLTLQHIPVYLIQAFFLCMSTTFVVAYFLSDHRGSRTRIGINSALDRAYLAIVLILGGMVSSLFGTGADMVLYTLLVSHFSMTAKQATRLSIVLQAAISVLGYAYRAFVDRGLTDFQLQTWLCAYPVVLFMAPFGAYVLSRLEASWMLRAIIALNLFQLGYFNLHSPSTEKLLASVGFSLPMSAAFYLALRQLSRRHKARSPGPQSATDPPP